MMNRESSTNMTMWIERKFLWGGVESKNKICWAKWEQTCKPEKDEGLGITDLGFMNLALFAKWR